jgi:YhcH/YjgK/YiaL family protein
MVIGNGEIRESVADDRVARRLTNFGGELPPMILDRLQTADRYTSLHPAFARAFAYLRDANWTQLTSAAQGAEHPGGRHPIDGDRMYVSIDCVDGRGREGARLEAHRRYIDIQFTIDGDEEIGWKSLGDCALTSVAYDEAKDVTFFRDRPDSWLSLPAGRFAIFFPDDAHAPLAGRGTLKKAIVKIAVF